MAEDQRSDGLVAGRRRVITLVAGVALLSMAVGMILARRVMSPEEAASRTAPPQAESVTAPVERRIVQNQVLTRGDFVYEGAIDVSIETGSMTGNPVVTGQVPRVGDPVDAGMVLLQIAGRPVIVLPGEVPPYRDLRPGLSGEDVLQLKQALVALGVNPGDAQSNLYDQATATAVGELYARMGYDPPLPDPARAETLTAAEDRVMAAEDDLADAQQALAEGTTPPGYSEQLHADAAVAAAELAFSQAQQAENPDPAAIAEAQRQLTIAETERAELLAPRDATFLQGAVTRAQTRLTRARDEVAALESTTGTALPAAEVVYLPSLPRRVDSVSVTRGRAVDGPVLRVSGADLIVVASLSAIDSELLSPGMAAQLQVGENVIEGTVAAVRPTPIDPAAAGGEQQPQDNGGAGQASRRFQAVITPSPLTAEQVQASLGQNVRVTIPVQASAGEVLAVPLAALSAGENGEARVTLLQPGGETERMVVDVGLTAGGYAEIRPRDDGLTEGDRVVVGR